MNDFEWTKVCKDLCDNYPNYSIAHLILLRDQAADEGQFDAAEYIQHIIDDMS